MAAYVSDWSQEVYPDWRKTAVPGSTAQQRRDYLNDYLQHQLVLARVAPPTIEPARTLHPERLRAARERGLVVGHGLRLVGDPVRPDAVVRLAPGLRAAGVQRLARPAAGPLGLRVGAAQRRALVRRLRLAVGPRSSTGWPPRSATRPRSPTRPTPGSRRARTRAASDYPGGSFTELWKSFRTWTQPLLTFTTAAADDRGRRTVGADVARPAERDGRGAGRRRRRSRSRSRSSSPRGQFSLAPTGPWTPTLALSIPQAGARPGRSTTSTRAPGATRSPPRPRA